MLYSVPINILAVTNSLNFDDLLCENDFVHEAVVADSYAIRVLCTSKFLTAGWKRIRDQSFSRGEDSRYSRRGSLRKSFFVEDRHCSLNDAIALQVGNKLVVRHNELVAALRNHS